MSFVYVLYTGGTFGMNYQYPELKKGPLLPRPFDEVIPFLKGFKFLSTVDQNKRQLSLVEFENFRLLFDTFDNVLDSSTLNHRHWQKMAAFVEQHYDQALGFIIIQGSDTLAYSASALSFMLKNLDKPVVMTAAELPIFFKHSDALGNFKLACNSIMKKKINSKVWIAFGNQVLLGCSTTKIGRPSNMFEALKIKSAPPYINPNNISHQTHKFEAKLAMHTKVLPIFVTPSLTPANLGSILKNKEFEAFIFMTYGAGNFSVDKKYHLPIKQALEGGKVIAAVSQMPTGQVVAGYYATSFCYIDDRILNLKNMTIEAALTKLMWAIANLTGAALVDFMINDQVGEML